jgi:P-type Ca2+ transporter type 2C
MLRGQTYVGTIGCKDPLRPEVKDAVLLASTAGIRTVMITGDHKLIAQNIATELGIVKNSKEVMDGTDLASVSEQELDQHVKHINAFSRVSPEQKLNIVQSAQRNGEVVIVTGDGVNDAPAIKTADIGVAMGITGTDVAKEAADMVLRDDNYSTIVKAIEQGRGIFGNFIKFLKYQISCNLSGVLIVLPISVATGTTPLFPVHILLLNLISETGPSIALGLEKPERDIMNAKPRRKNERLLHKKRWARIIFEAVVLAGAGILAYFIAYDHNPATATTAVLVTAFLSRLWHSFTSRSENRSIFSSHIARNNIMYYTVIGTLAILLLAVYTSIGNEVIKTVALPLELLLMCATVSLLPLVVMEVYKLIRSKIYFGVRV